MPAKGKTQTTKRSATAHSYPAARRKKTMEPTAHSQVLDEVTEEVITDPETIESIERGLADLKAGRVKPWKEVKRNV